MDSHIDKLDWTVQHGADHLEAVQIGAVVQCDNIVTNIEVHIIGNPFQRVTHALAGIQWDKNGIKHRQSFIFM